MFDLEKGIASWRGQMRAAGITSPRLLDELENHLRDEIERQMKLGLNDQAAFAMATESMGRGNLLRAEFQKVCGLNPFPVRKKAGWIYAVILGFYSVATTGVMAKNNLSINEWLSGLASMATLLASSLFIWRVAPRFFPAVPGKRLPSAIGLVGGISGAVWFMVFTNLILPRFDFTPGQLVVAILWAMVPMLVLPNLAFLMIDKSENLPAGAIGRK